MRARSSILGAALGSAVTGLLFCACSSGGAPTLSDGCLHTSDCKGGLVCLFQVCAPVCVTDRDCPTGARCLVTDNGPACVTPAQSACPGAACPAGTVCASDDLCRTNCTPVSGLSCVMGQVCEGTVCVGTDPSHDPGATSSSVLAFAPSNFNPAPVYTVGLDGGAPPPSIDLVGAVTQTALPPPIELTLDDQSVADLYVMQSFLLEANASLTLSDTRPVVFVVLGTADIQGSLLLQGGEPGAGPGGFAGGNSPTSPGPGGGLTAQSTTQGGGGGGYCGHGGSGIATSATSSNGGVSYPGPAIVPLIGGSAGGGAGDGGGGGGGAIQIVASVAIFVRENGQIDASGGAGGGINFGGGGGGGGSGGAILLEAPAVTIDGKLTANGGSGSAGGSSAPGVPGTGGTGAMANGGDAALQGGTGAAGGGGAAGRIRINTTMVDATISGTVSPDAMSGCATQGMLAQ